MSAFQGVRVVDFSQGVAGPMATMFLADFEAEVIKVEPPAGDRMRDHPGYLCWNRNKARLTLDLHRYDGLRTARELVATADVAVFDALPGELERLGLDATTLLGTNPALVHAWLPPYGSKGRWSQLPPGHHSLLAGLCGAAYTQFSYAQDQPVHLTTPQLFYNQAVNAAAAIAAALFERSKSGQGQALTVSGLHGAAAAKAGSAVTAAGVMRMGGGNPRGGSPSYRLYECADGKWFFLGTLFAPFFLKALEVTDLIDLLAEEEIGGEFAKLLAPPGSTLAVERLDACFKEKPRAEWLRLLKANDVPCGPVNDREEWFRSETVAANRMRIELEHPKLGTVALPGVPVRLSAAPGSVRHLARTVKAADLPSHAPAAPAAGETPAAEGGPLAGVRVLDLGVVIAGTFSGAILAQMGADVIKVEPPDGDPFRPYGLGFAGYNRGKRGLCLDLKSADGLRAFLDLARTADVILDNYRAGVRERLGIDYPALRAVNPRIISCSVTSYGREGPFAAEPGFDPLLQAQSGMMAAQGGDGEPVFYQIPVNDVATAATVAFAVVAALNVRERTGEGQEVLTSLADQSVMFQSGELTWYEGRPPAEIGARDCIGAAALQRYYRCNDGWLGVSCSKPEQFHALCSALEQPQWAGRYLADKALREPRDSELAGLIAGALSELSRADALDRLLTAGVPAAPVAGAPEMFGDAWLWENGYFERYEHPQFGEVTGIRGFARWSRTPGGFPRRAPLLGEHSVDVLRECGFDETRIEGLVGAGVVIQAEAE